MSNVIGSEEKCIIEALGAFDFGFEDENFNKLVDAVNEVKERYDVSVDELKEIIKQHSNE